jgi:hypothetical protein
MSRTVISREELQEWLTTEIKKFEGCEECSFGIGAIDGNRDNYSDLFA